MDWRLPAALVGLSILLVGAQALVSQVKDDLNAAVDQELELRETPFEKLEGSTRLQMRNLRLPEDVEVTLPEGTEINPDLSKLRLDEDVEIPLPPDLSLDDINLNIPEGTKLRLPEGTIFDGKNLQIPDGLQGTLPDGMPFDLPPGTELTLPPDLAERLMDQGLHPGALPEDFEFEMPRLPGGQGVLADLPPLPDGGNLNLPAGTEINLPPDRFPPGLPRGVLPRDMPVTLPAGSQVNLPPGYDPTGGPEGGYPPPVPPGGELPPCPDGSAPRRSPRGSWYECPTPPGEGPRNPPTGPLRPTLTEIDTYDERARKGEPFHVGGYVVTLEGAPVRDAPVDVFLNETKETPGAHVGGTRSGADGRWSALVTLPPDKRAGTYQLVARANAFSTAMGERYGESWSDPPVHFTASTVLSARLVQGEVTGTLADAWGVPVPEAPITLLREDVVLAQAATDAHGAFSFDAAGEASGLLVRYGGDPHHDPAEASVERALESHAGSAPSGDRPAPSVVVTAETRVRLTVADVVPVGARVQVDGVLEDLDRVGVPQALVNLTSSAGHSGSALTDSRGVFRFYVRFSDPGTYDVEVGFDGDDAYEPSSITAKIEATRRAFDLDPVPEGERGSPLTLTGRVLDDGAPQSGVAVTVTALARQYPAVTDGAGRFVVAFRVPTTAPLGETSVAFTAGTDLSATRTLHVFAPGTLVLELPEKWPLGNAAKASVTLTSVDGAPLPGIPLEARVEGPGSPAPLNAPTAGDGVARLSIPAQGGAGSYRVTVAPAAGSFVRAEPASASVRFGELSVDWALPEQVVRGRDATPALTLRFDGEPLAREPARLTLLSPLTGDTDASGRATYRLSIPANAPVGPASALLEVPGLDYTASRDTRVAAPTEIRLDAPPSYGPGDVVRVNATLVDNLGNPVGGRMLEVSLVRPDGWTSGATSYTTEAGVTSSSFNTERVPEALALTASFPGDENYLAASVTADLPVNPLYYVGQSLPAVIPVAVGVGGIGGAGLLAVGLFYWSRRRHAAGAGTAPLFAKRRDAPISTEPAGPRLLLDFPRIDPDLPDVWGKGDPLLLRVSAPPEANAKGARVRVSAAGDTTTRPLESDGVFTLDLPGLPEGEIEFRADPPIDLKMAPGTVTLRIVDYPTEIAREFDQFLERARARWPHLGKQATAREVAWTVEADVEPHAANALGQIADVMDRANYSHHAVGRDEYARFVRALRVLEPALDAPPPAPAPRPETAEGDPEPERATTGGPEAPDAESGEEAPSRE